MKANELRIGNLVRSKIDIRQKQTVEYIQYQVSRITEKAGVVLFTDRALHIHKTTHIDFINLYPIPLTEELLLKFGFDKLHIGNGKTYLKNVNGFGWSICLDTFNIGFDYLEYNNLGLCKYVHQLQNLYFALTGRELEYKGS